MFSYDKEYHQAELQRFIDIARIEAKLKKSQHMCLKDYAQRKKLFSNIQDITCNLYYGKKRAFNKSPNREGPTALKAYIQEKWAEVLQAAGTTNCEEQSNSNEVRANGEDTSLAINTTNQHMEIPIVCKSKFSDKYCELETGKRDYDNVTSIIVKPPNVSPLYQSLNISELVVTRRPLPITKIRPLPNNIKQCNSQLMRDNFVPRGTFWKNVRKDISKARASSLTTIPELPSDDSDISLDDTYNSVGTRDDLFQNIEMNLSTSSSLTNVSELSSDGSDISLDSIAFDELDLNISNLTELSTDISSLHSTSETTSASESARTIDHEEDISVSEFLAINNDITSHDDNIPQNSRLNVAKRVTRFFRSSVFRVPTCLKSQTNP